MSEVTEKKPQKKLRLFGQHPDRQSRLVPERKVSEHQGAVFRIVYKDKGRHERSEWYGRIVDFQPALDRDKVVGVYISYRPGRFGGIKGAWEEDREGHQGPRKATQEIPFRQKSQGRPLYPAELFADVKAEHREG